VQRFKELLRPATLLTKKILNRLRLAPNKSHLEYSGPFESWELAVASSVGYDSPYALHKVREGVESVLKNEKTYERDGTSFDQLPERYSLRTHIKNLLRENSVIVDFGGGLGGTYVNNSDLFSSEWKGKYFVVEQPSFCEAGTDMADTYDLPVIFTSDIKKIPMKPSIVIFSGVLQYIQHWGKVVGETLAKEPNYIIIDRQPLTSDDTLVYVQENDGYYKKKVSYPSRIINRIEFLSTFAGYEVIQEWKSDFDPDDHMGFLLKAAK